jgi:hypothetical protein
LIAALVELLIGAAALDVLANHWASGELLESDPTAHLTAAMWVVATAFPDPEREWCTPADPCLHCPTCVPDSPTSWDPRAEAFWS